MPNYVMVFNTGIQFSLTDYFILLTLTCERNLNILLVVSDSHKYNVSFKYIIYY